MRDAIAKPNFFAAKVVLYVFNEWSEKRFNSFWHLWVTFAVKRSHFLRIQLTFLTTLHHHHHQAEVDSRQLSLSD